MAGFSNPSKTGALVGPDLQKLAGQLLDLAKMDAKNKEPLRRRLKTWQAAVISRMKAEAPDDPETGGSRIEKALRAKAPVISRGRQRITAGFIVDGAKLGAMLDGKDKGMARGVAVSLVQHEDLTIRHRRGNAKFMERPLFTSGGRVADIVEEAFDEIAANIK